MLLSMDWRREAAVGGRTHRGQEAGRGEAGPLD